MSESAVGGEYAVEAGQIHTRFGHQGGQADDEVERLEDDVGGAVTIRSLELIAHISLPGQGQPIGGNGRSGDVAAQELGLAPLVGLGDDTGVQREAGSLG